MPSEDAKLRRTVSIAACVLTAAAIVLPPAIYFALSYQHAAGIVEAEAEINARVVTRVIGANPDLWKYEHLRFSEYLGRRAATGEAERRRIVDERGAVVAEIADPLPRPWLTRSVPLFDAGAPVGSMEVSRSLRPLLVRSGVLALALLVVGLLAYRAVRTVPLRAIERGQAALRRQKELAQRYFDVAGVAFVVQDETGCVTRVNRQGCELLGRFDEEVLGRGWLESFVDPSDRARVASELSAVASPDEVTAMEYSILRPSGERRLVSWYVTPLFDEQGRRTRLLASGVDVTHQAQLEDELRKAQKLEAIGRLAGGVAHDFNNALSALKMRAVLLRRGLQEEDPRRRLVDDMLGSIDRAAALTRNLLTFGRRRPARFEAIDLVELLRRFEQSARSLLRDGIELRVVAPAAPLAMTGDPLELERVLMNLFANAQDAMPSGGRIVISASRTEVPDARASGVAAPGQYAELSVSDSGTGIPAEAHPRLFEPFFTTKGPGKGTGLGLSIAYAIVKQHRGEIRVVSEPGTGATFTVLLPLFADESRPAAPASA